MHTWPVQDAKAHFSELLHASITQGAQIITLRGKETAVLISIAEWQRLQKTQPSLKSLLLAPSIAELDIPDRGTQRRRNIEPFE
ncbi:MAG: type II toxin-antitoxin system Phd/YefM family antitoxin [Agitococcus sp.]|nr:type II toxin-antitoxin system Phd/YefM family antitoxin [Agitococcus sp.]